MKEKDIYKRMKDRFGMKMFLQKIESARIPDIHYCIDNKRSGWIEMKVVKRFPRNGILKIPFRPGQYAWIREYRKYSDRVFLFLHIQDSLFIFKGGDILPWYAESILHECSIFDELWPEVNWNEVFSLL